MDLLVNKAEVGESRSEGGEEVLYTMVSESGSLGVAFVWVMEELVLVCDIIWEGESRGELILVNLCQVFEGPSPFESTTLLFPVLCDAFTHLFFL